MQTHYQQKKGDTGPPLDMVLYEGAAPADLTTASTIRFLMRDENDAQKINALCTVLGAATAGTVRYAWQAADTDTEKRYRAEVQVTYADGTIVTYPKRGYLTIDVVKDLGP